MTSFLSIKSVLFSSFHASVRRFVCYRTCKHNIFRTIEPILMQISTYVLPRNDQVVEGQGRSSMRLNWRPYFRLHRWVAHSVCCILSICSLHNIFYSRPGAKGESEWSDDPPPGAKRSLLPLTVRALTSWISFVCEIEYNRILLSCRFEL